MLKQTLMGINAAAGTRNMAHPGRSATSAVAPSSCGAFFQNTNPVFFERIPIYIQANFLLKK